jgi:hypothetical protein
MQFVVTNCGKDRQEDVHLNEVDMLRTHNAGLSTTIWKVKAFNSTVRVPVIIIASEILIISSRHVMNMLEVADKSQLYNNVSSKDSSH